LTLSFAFCGYFSSCIYVTISLYSSSSIIQYRPLPMNQIVNIFKLTWLSEEARRFAHEDAHSKYIIDNRMFTIQFKNGRWSENISLQKLNVNLSSCLNLFSVWDILNFMIAILVYNCQQYLYKKKCTSTCIVIFPQKKLNSMIMNFFLFCYGVLMKLCFYLKNHN
jgi:hypothetical protein